MSDNVTWIVDLDALLDEAPQLAEQIKAWLIGEAVVSATPCQALGAEHLLSRGAAAAKWDAFPHTGHVAMCGLEISIQRRVFHTGDNGIGGIRCPDCGVTHHPDDLPWSDAVDAWFSGESDHSMTCPACRASASIVAWEFDPAWGFGNLACGFWNWPIANQLLTEIATITGHRCRVVHEHI
jgi:Zn ribbon nucleic-acid-binding protein